MLFRKGYSQKKKHLPFLKICITVILSISLLFPCIPPGTAIAIAGTGSGVPESADYDPEADRLVVKTVRGTDLKALAEASGGELLRTGPLNYCILQFKGLGTKLPEREQIRQKVLKFPGVLSAEWGKRYKADGSFIITETAGKVTVSIGDPEYGQQWGLKKIRADRVWDEGATGKDIVIAVLDTGVDLDHPDFVDPVRKKDNLVPGYNAITRSTLPGAAQDDNGHGTAVAGVIAALKNNQGIIGVAYEAKIMPIKVMDRTGEGEDSIIADGIVWAADNGARILNLSISSEEQDKVLEDAIQYAVDKGCLLIASSGNTQGFAVESYGEQARNKISRVAYPGANPNVLAVSAIDRNDRITEFSLTGSEVALAAPGKSILTDHWSADEAGCTYSTGTSIAAPFVTGTAALLWSKYPSFTAKDIKEALISAAYDLGETGRDDCYGYGRVDAYRALTKLGESKVLSSPAQVGWEGGKVIDGETAENADAQVIIPSGTFPLRILNDNNEEKISISLNKVLAPQDFPAPIISASDTYSLSWGEAQTEKAVTLELKLNPKELGEDNPVTDPNTMQKDITPGDTKLNYLAYLYRWSGSRWLRVGGGVTGNTPRLCVTIYEPGIYRAGYSPESKLSRISGTDRILTAVEVARQAFPTGADTVILARSDDFPDALAGAPLAYKYQAPILLTSPTKLPDEVSELISDLAPKKIFILGGTGAVSAEIEKILLNCAQVQRIAGDNRSATAAAVADMLGTKGQAVVVNSLNFPDAISAASYAAYQGKPILLTPADKIAPETEAAIKRLLVTHTEIIGGSKVISEQIKSVLPNPTRLSGEDRFATSAVVIQASHSLGNVLYIATGMNYPDALAGGILAASASSSIILIPEDGPTAVQTLILETFKGKKIIALGGEGAVTPEAILKVQKIIGLNLNME